MTTNIESLTVKEKRAAYDRAARYIRSCAEDEGPDSYEEACELFAAIFWRRPSAADGDLGELWSHCCAAVEAG